MPAGNCSVLVILNSRRTAERVTADQAVFPMLDHLGVAYEALECADYMAVPAGHVEGRALYILAHDGAGAGVAVESAVKIMDAVRNGAGLVSFDRDCTNWPKPLRAVLPDDLSWRQTESLVFAADHFITAGHNVSQTIELESELQLVTPAEHDPDWTALVRTDQGKAAVMQRSAGAGRVVFFGCGPDLFTSAVFGHTRGIDGLQWRAFVWAAAKPFPMRAMPPYVTARMDDCNGAYGSFHYVRDLNRHGVSPNLGLFIDELGPTDWRVAKELHERGGADFSMHAFRDDFYKARPNYTPFAVCDDKPDLSDGGRQTLFEGLSVDHVTGRDLDAAVVAANVARMDDAFAAAGIRHSVVINSHFGEIGFRAVPHFLARGATMPCNGSVVGQLYGNQPPWRPRPYGYRGKTGRYGLVIDRSTAHPDLLCASVSSGHLGLTHMQSDILAGNVPFLGESETPRIDRAITRGIENVELGLDMMAWGLIMTHEERIDAISPEDWRKCVDGIMAGIRCDDAIPASREHVSRICRRLFESRLGFAHRDDDGLHCEICGRTDGPSPLTIWSNEGSGCRREWVDIPAVDGFVSVQVKDESVRLAD